ncbi:hypothetical protein [Actinoplanes sp. NPDC023714]|uniref:hypothetical protein n=1 Tax=Actinoplanes sp. NPDC023714 TaxID=3154322 RepID=UPI0033E05421
MTYPPPVDPYESPQHTEPLFEQPHYGQHHGQPTYPMAPPPPPAKSRTLAITLLTVSIVLVVLVGGGVVAYLVGDRFSGNKSVQGTSTSANPTPSASSPAPQDTISISEPDTLNGQPKIEANELASLTTDLEKELEGYPGAANAFGAVYGALGQKKLTAALAAEVDVDDPQRMLDTMFQSFSGESQLEGVSPASTGSLGGVAQCGSTTVAKEDVAICGWADEGSVGMLLFFYETAVDVKGDFPDMRAEIETKD